MKVVFGDNAYAGLSDWLTIDSNNNIRLEVVKRLDAIKLKSNDSLQFFLIKDKPVIERPIKMDNNDGKFPILKWRWVVERTLSWLSKNRRLSKIYERLPSTVENYCNIAMSRIMLKRLAVNSFG